MSSIRHRMMQMQTFILRNRNRKLVAEKAGLHMHTVGRFLNGNMAITIGNFFKIESAVEEIMSDPLFIDKKNSPRRDSCLVSDIFKSFMCERLIFLACFGSPSRRQFVTVVGDTSSISAIALLVRLCSFISAMSSGFFMPPPSSVDHNLPPMLQRLH